MIICATESDIIKHMDNDRESFIRVDILVLQLKAYHIKLIQSKEGIKNIYA
jgi:hypothetical protein